MNRQMTMIPTSVIVQKNVARTSPRRLFIVAALGLGAQA